MGIRKKPVGILTLVAIVLGFSLAGCRGTTEGPAPAAKGPTKDEDIAAIKEVYAKEVAAYNARDAAAMAALHSDDALFMAPGEPKIVGREAIKSMRQKQFDWITKEITAGTLAEEAEEVGVAGDWAFARGTFRFVGTSKVGGKPVDDVGKWIDILERQPDGSWKMHRDCWNSDKPPSTTK
jgi:uncharacterized protein (TIGR02246 family)